MFPYYTPWKQQKTFVFSDVFSGYKMGTLARTGLNQIISLADQKLLKSHSLSFNKFLKKNFAWTLGTERDNVKNRWIASISASKKVLQSRTWSHKLEYNFNKLYR